MFTFLQQINLINIRPFISLSVLYDYRSSRAVIIHNRERDERLNLIRLATDYYL